MSTKQPLSNIVFGVEMIDADIVSKLRESYQQQLGWYRELLGLDQKVLNALVLSRGGLPQVLDLHTKKKDLLDRILRERTKSADVIAAWQERKALMPQSLDVSALNTLLGETENVIRDFLNCEDQLKRYLSRMAEQRQS